MCFGRTTRPCAALTPLFMIIDTKRRTAPPPSPPIAAPLIISLSVNYEEPWPKLSLSSDEAPPERKWRPRNRTRDHWSMYWICSRTCTMYMRERPCWGKITWTNKTVPQRTTDRVNKNLLINPPPPPPTHTLQAKIRPSSASIDRTEFNP